MKTTTALCVSRKLAVETAVIGAWPLKFLYKDSKELVDEEFAKAFRPLAEGQAESERLPAGPVERTVAAGVSATMTALLVVPSPVVGVLAFQDPTGPLWVRLLCGVVVALLVFVAAFLVGFGLVKTACVVGRSWPRLRVALGAVASVPRRFKAHIDALAAECEGRG